MKRPTLVLTLLCMFVVSQVSAQENSIFIGANGGFNLSSLKYSEDLKELYPISNNRAGVNAGVALGFEFQDWLFTTGLQYIQKGGKYQSDIFDDDFGTGFLSAKERQHFLSIPLLIGYRKNLSEKFGATISAGPSINFGLKGKIDETYEYFGEEELEKQHYDVEFGKGVNDDYKKTQIGFQIVPSLFYKVNKKSKIHLTVTWDVGTSDSFNQRYKRANDFFSDYKGDQINQSAIFTLGYTRHFTFGDKY